MSSARIIRFNTLKPSFLQARYVSCWSCGQNIHKLVVNLFCSHCNVLQKPEKDISYFKIMGLSETFDLDETDLAKRYKDLQKHLHPDKYANKNKEEQEISARYSSLVNEAYKTLLEPLQRAVTNTLVKVRPQQPPPTPPPVVTPLHNGSHRDEPTPPPRKLWDLGCSLRSYRFRGHDEAVTDVTFSPTGKYMASASRDKTVRLWVPTVTGSTGMFKAHSQTVRSVQFSSDGTKIITASDDKIVKIWSSEKYKFISSLVGHTNWVRCARMSNDGSVVASCSDDKTTKLWNPDSGELIHTYKDQKGHGLHLAWHPSGCYIAIGTSRGNIKLYDIRTHNLVQYYRS